MASIKIVTDSTSDIPLSVAHELGIEIVPMHIHVGEQTFRAGLDITSEQFYPWMQDGRAKGTMFKLHFTQYDNHSDIPSYAGGYGNIFQDERDVKFMVIAPFTIF